MSSASAEQKANAYLVERCLTSMGKRHDNIAVASCCASFLDEVHRDVAKFTFTALPRSLIHDWIGDLQSVRHEEVAPFILGSSLVLGVVAQ